MTTVAEVDCSTGDVVHRELTPEEAAQRASEMSAAVQRSAQEQQSATNRSTVEQRAVAALAANAAFLAVAAPTSAQTLAQVRTLTKESSALIRLLLNKLESVEGT